MIETFNEYQEKSKKTDQSLVKVEELYPNINKDVLFMLSMSYYSLGLGEVGEVQGKLKKIIRDRGGKVDDEVRKEVSKELGDVLWYLSQLASLFDLKLDDIATENIVKLYDRLNRGVISGSGDNR
jgi:NTP pyrophosphatase (non-canonical NTP hydrolase)